MKITNTALVLITSLGMSLTAYAANDSLAEKRNPMMNTTNRSDSEDRSLNTDGDNSYNSAEKLDQAVNDGRLSRKDADSLKQDYEKVDKMKRDANKDGYVSNTEKALIKKEEDRYSSRVRSSMNQ